MNFIKKMCILRQVKQGFSGDGKTLSGLIKIEQYGKNLSVEVSVINFAPLSSGEYYCLLADNKGRTEMLPLRGKSLFNIVSELNADEGFCGVICFVKNGIVPIAYGVNGENVYDWRTLVKNSAPAGKKETAFSAAGGTETYVADDLFRERPAPLTATEAPPSVEIPFDSAPASLRADEEPRKAAKYDDETVATENYYRKEEMEDERVENEKSGTYAHAESGDQEQTKKERQDPATDGDAADIRHPFETDSDGYYRAVKGEIDELFAKYPADESLKGIFAYSEWVRIQGEENNPKYLVGVIYDDLKAKYICYALPAENKDRPPEEIKEICTFVPSSAFTDKEGFFVIFQSCSTGESIRPESI